MQGKRSGWHAEVIPLRDFLGGRENTTLTAVLNPFQKGVGVADVPLWKEELAAKLRPNPEARGSFEEYVAKAPGGLTANHALDYKHLTEATNFADGLDAKYFRGHKGFQGLSLRELLEYAKAKPGRFAAGVGLGLAGLGAAGYGLHRLYNLFTHKAPMTPDEAVTIKTAAQNDVLEFYQVKTALAFPGGVPKGLTGMIGAAASKWGGNVAQAAHRANQAGGLVAQRAGGGLGGMAQGAFQAGKSFLKAPAGRQAVGAGIGALGLGYGAARMMGSRPQPQQPGPQGMGQ